MSQFVHRRKSGARKLVRAPTETATEAIGVLERGCRMFGLTKGQFSKIDLIRACLASTGPAHLVLSPGTTGIRDAENIAFLQKHGDLLSLRLLTDSSSPSRQPDYCRTVTETFGVDAIRVCYIHAKFALLGNDEWKLCIRSSMNLNRNPRLEQFDIDDDADLYDFILATVDDISQEMPAGLAQPNLTVQKTFEAILGGGFATEAYRAEEDEGGWGKTKGIFND